MSQHTKQRLSDAISRLKVNLDNLEVTEAFDEPWRYYAYFRLMLPKHFVRQQFWRPS